MKQIGDHVGLIQLPDIYGTMFRSDQLAGKRYLLSFHRFASCPYCRTQLRQRLFRHSELARDFSIITIFNSPVAELRACLMNYQTSFTILSDVHWQYYRGFGIEQSLSGTIRGFFTRFSSLIDSVMMHGDFPREFKLKQELTMPADFLVNEYGEIDQIYWGRDPGDHMDFEQIKDFSYQRIQCTP